VLKCVQANPICKRAGYKQLVLDALPQLTNLDGERNPRVPGYSAVVEVAAEALDTLEICEPTFSFPEPERWLLASDLVVPEAGTESTEAAEAAQAALQSAVASAEEGIEVRGSGTGWLDFWQQLHTMLLGFSRASSKQPDSPWSTRPHAKLQRAEDWSFACRLWRTYCKTSR
jgi:hypothetical protein